MRVTEEYVNNRFKEFADKYWKLLEFLGYASSNVEEWVTVLSNRLASRDFKQYGTRPINDLHGGKRITRFAIRTAIEHCPSEKQRRERLQQEYNARAAEIRQYQPHASFFSFEAAYADKLKVDMRPHRQWFCI
jgi:hypothetical protein